MVGKNSINYGQADSGHRQAFGGCFHLLEHGLTLSEDATSDTSIFYGKDSVIHQSVPVNGLNFRFGKCIVVDPYLIDKTLE